MPVILQGRPNLRPYLYEQFHLAHEAVIASPWSYKEAQMSSDKLDWERVSEADRNTIGGILRGFTLIEIGATCYWRDIVARSFKHPEIVMMATSFSHQETIHAKAYDHLDATLGLDSYKAFLQDKLAIAKLDNILSLLADNDLTNLANSLAVFSGAVEGVSLFASFAILLSFTKKSLFKGMAQILSWSVLDEQLHSTMGIQLYKQLVEEAGEQIVDKARIKEGFQAIIANELAFIEQAFADGDLETISKEEASDFVKYRANKKLMELGLKPMYLLSGAYKQVKQFFDTQVEGTVQNDFFALARNGGAYSAMLSQDFYNGLKTALPG